MNDENSDFLEQLVSNDKNIYSVQRLLDEWEVQEVRNSAGNTLLHLATKSLKDNPLIVEELIKSGFDTDDRNYKLMTPLHFAVINQKRRVVEVLLNYVKFINNRDCYGRTALHYAADKKICLNPRLLEISFSSIFKMLLNHDHINVNLQDEDGYTPLLQAVASKEFEMVKLLVARNAKLNICNWREENALHVALSCEDPCPTIIYFLLLSGVNLLKLNKKGETPLYIIIKFHPFGLARICLKAVALIYKKCDNSVLLLNNLLNTPELLMFLKNCFSEICQMKCDVIVNNFTVFDFSTKPAPVFDSHIHLFQFNKSVVLRLVSGLYPEYFRYILSRISKSSLIEILASTIAANYYHKKYSACGFKKEHSRKFSMVIGIAQLSEYLTCLDTFCLIVAFTNVNIDESKLNFRYNDCYLPDSWD